jgi:hypothetical protein
MDGITFRKPKLLFDVVGNPSHVTFDDGKELRRNIPWLHYVEARWDHSELDTIKVEIGDWLIVISGQNLGPLFLAIEDRTLARVRAQPRLREDREREFDTFATEIRFTKPPMKNLAKQRGQIEFDLGGGEKS